MNTESYLNIVGKFGRIVLLLEDEGFTEKDTVVLSRMFLNYLNEVEERLELERLKNEQN